MGLWPPGRVAPFLGSVLCYAQTFSLGKGLYYFGGLDYYVLSNFRDALIVATSRPQSLPLLPASTAAPFD